MSKYIIDLRPDCKVVQQICVSDDNVGVGARSVELFDALTDEYVKENFKDLLEGEYQRGLEEGREQMPCDTCAYRHNKLLCADCKWTYGSRYKVDSIGVGDIIANNTEPKLKVWVTGFDEIGFCGIAITDFGTVDEGKLYSSCSPKGWHKIGHFDINKILEGGAL